MNPCKNADPHFQGVEFHWRWVKPEQQSTQLCTIEFKPLRPIGKTQLIPFKKHYDLGNYNNQVFRNDIYLYG